MTLELSILCVHNDEIVCCYGVVADIVVVAAAFDFHVNCFCDFHGYSCEHGSIHLYVASRSSVWSGGDLAT